MTTLENLYYGNINPCDSETLINNPKYRNSLARVNMNQQKLIAALNEQQRELFETYLTSASELSTVINEDTFKNGFSLAMKIMIEMLYYNN